MPYLSIAKIGFISKFDLCRLSGLYFSSSRPVVSGSICRYVISLRERYQATRPYSTITGNGVNSETGRLCFPGCCGNTDIFWICPCRILTDRTHRQYEEENVSNIRDGRNAKPPIPFISPTDRDCSWRCPNPRKVIILIFMR